MTTTSSQPTTPPALPKPTSKKRFDTLELLQPRFRASVVELVASMHARGYDALVFETYRTRARNIVLSKRGTGIKPRPDGSVPIGMHEMGLAVDIVSASKMWSAPPAFWAALGDEARRLGLTWGGDWRRRDKPHVQSHPVREQPALRARFKRFGFHGVER